MLIYIIDFFHTSPFSFHRKIPLILFFLILRAVSYVLTEGSRGQGFKDSRMQRLEGDQALHSNAKAFQLQNYFWKAKRKIHLNSVLFSFQQGPVRLSFFSFGMLGILEKSFLKKKSIRLYYLNVLILT